MKELWLEFGYKKEKNYYDMLWYNEGRIQEFPYFIKNFIKDLFNGNLFKQKMYYKIRFR